jgi:aldose 1-epimerase
MEAESIQPHTISIADEAGNTANVLTGYGCNCFSVRFAAVAGKIESIWAPPGLGIEADQAFRGGIPLLFPFAGRLRGRGLKWLDGEYRFVHMDGLGNGIHGLVGDRPWRVIHAGGDSVTAVFQLSVDAWDRLPCWPADFHIEASYGFFGGRLRGSFLVTNPDRVPLPFGLGLHPYFRLPRTANLSNPCRLHLPFLQRWILRDMLPTGQTVPLDGRFRADQGFPLGKHEFDDVLTGCSSDGDHWRAQIADLESGFITSLAASANFTECVLYTPPHRHAVSIEPLSSVPDAPELLSKGIGQGLHILEPGESRHFWIEVWVDVA